MGAAGAPPHHRQAQEQLLPQHGQQLDAPAQEGGQYRAHTVALPWYSLSYVPKSIFDPLLAFVVINVFHDKGLGSPSSIQDGPIK